jgi:futalosine hydrolase
LACKLLVCAATLIELRTFLRDDEVWPVDDTSYWAGSGTLALAVTGVGIPCTLLHLPALLASLEPEFVLNIGIAGAYPSSGLTIGAVGMARSETIGDIGFELPEEPGFRLIADAPFGRFYRKLPMALRAEFRHAPSGYPTFETDACTVNACTGTARTGLMRERLFGVGMESMEGAAVALACEAAGVPACEVRAISNIAADRNMLPENIRLAMENLRDYLLACRGREGI